MSETKTQLIVEQGNAEFVVANSELSLNIKNYKTNFKDNDQISSGKIQLWSSSKAAWSVTMVKLSGIVRFFLSIDGLSEIYQSNYKFLFKVISSKDAQLIFESYSNALKSGVFMFDVNATEVTVDGDGSLALNIQLLVTDKPRIRKKFHDPTAPKCAILSSLKSTMNDRTFTDFKFIVKGQEFNVHKVILAASSPVMLALFTNDMEENKTNESKVGANINAETFKVMLAFMYHGEIPENLEAVAKPLYEAANYFDIKQLMAICAQEVYTDLSVENAMEAYKWAYDYDLESLKFDAFEIIKREILKIFIPSNVLLKPERIEEILEERQREGEFWMKFPELAS